MLCLQSRFCAPLSLSPRHVCGSVRVHCGQSPRRQGGCGAAAMHINTQRHRPSLASASGARAPQPRASSHLQGPRDADFEGRRRFIPKASFELDKVLGLAAGLILGDRDAPHAILRRGASVVVLVGTVTLLPGRRYGERARRHAIAERARNNVMKSHVAQKQLLHWRGSCATREGGKPSTPTR